jgi:hypothetical protein
LRAGTKGVPIGEPKSLRLKIFSLAVFFFGEIVFPMGRFERRATQIDPLQISVDGPNVG